MKTFVNTSDVCRQSGLPSACFGSLKRHLPFLFLLLFWLFDASPSLTQAVFYGMTSGGGTDGMGVIFKINPDGSGYEDVHEFRTPAPGANPYYGQLTKASNSRLYGMTRYGGTSDQGVIFEYDPATETYTKKKDFNENDGVEPFGSLTELNGKLYGMTVVGGAFNIGVLFEFDPTTDVYTKKVDFTDSIGSYPHGSLIVYDNKLYGMTRNGGEDIFSGVLFSYEPVAGVYEILKDFHNSSDGYNPYGSLTEYNGRLYGMTRYGGTSDDGVIFEYNPATHEYTKKLDFSTTNGANPYGNLIEFNGKLVGMASTSGGPFIKGVLFEYNPADNQFNKLVSFQDNIGSTPYGSLTKLNGNLYGMTSKGGSASLGVLFEYDPMPPFIYSIKINFNGDNGGKPYGSLMEYNGKLFGMTSEGGASNAGVLFEYDPVAASYKKKIDLNRNEGYYPWGSLTEYHGKLYGMTGYGGASDKGVLFEYDTLTHIYTKKKDFNDVDGSWPHFSNLVEFNGKMYGMTTNGGNGPSNPLYDGVLFEYDPATNGYIRKWVFGIDADGSRPYGGLTLYGGKLYGMTSLGGLYNANGVIFEYDPVSSIYTKKFDLNLNVGGGLWGPTDRLTEYNGKLYGLSYAGGSLNEGTLFEYNPATNVYVKKRDLNSTAGRRPTGSLLQYNGKLYGLTSLGGANDFGVIFDYNPSNSLYLKKKSFNGNDGKYPQGSLTEYNGKLYGMTKEGGEFDKGVMFEYDPATAAYSKIFDFDFNNGAYPWGNLTLVGQPVTRVTSMEDPGDISVSPNPASDHINIFNRGTSEGCLRLVATDGRILYTLQVNGLENRHLDVSDLPQGAIQWQWSPGSACANIAQSGKLILVR